MSNTKRVVFSFDERSFESLEKMTEQARYPSMGQTVKDSLQVLRALQNQAKQGYKEVIVRNPETNEERIIIVPDLLPEG